MKRTGFNNFQRFLASEYEKLESNLQCAAIDLSNMIDDDEKDVSSSMSSLSLGSPDVFDAPDYDPPVKNFAFINRNSTLAMPELFSNKVRNTFGPQNVYTRPNHGFVKGTVKELNYSFNPSRSSHNFHKKYPRRSQKKFSVVPKFDLDEDPDEKIDLRVLNIGPEHLYFSEQKKICIMLQTSVAFLSALAKQRQDIELHILKANYENQTITHDGNQDTRRCGYQFQTQLSCIIKSAKKEHAMAITIFKNLEPHCINNDPEFVPFGNGLVKKMKDAIDGLIRISNLQIIKSDGVLDISLYSCEVNEIRESLDAFALVTRNVCSELWALQQIIQNHLRSAQNI